MLALTLVRHWSAAILQTASIAAVVPAPAAAVAVERTVAAVTAVTAVHNPAHPRP